MKTQPKEPLENALCRCSEAHACSAHTVASRPNQKALHPEGTAAEASSGSGPFTSTKPLFNIVNTSAKRGQNSVNTMREEDSSVSSSAKLSNPTMLRCVVFCRSISPCNPGRAPTLAERCPSKVKPFMNRTERQGSVLIVRAQPIAARPLKRCRAVRHTILAKSAGADPSFEPHGRAFRCYPESIIKVPPPFRDMSKVAGSGHDSARKQIERHAREVQTFAP